MAILRLVASWGRLALVAAAVAVLLAACNTGPGTDVNALGVGNGLPSGAHYNLNIIGVANPKTASMDTSSGHVIFVALSGHSKIDLQEGSDFAVLDANATDGSDALFQLPNPDPDNTGYTEYTVYARELGKPGGSANMTTCAEDDTGTTYCSIYSAVFVREKGGPKTQNVSKQLLYVYADLDGDGTVERYPLFDDALQGYYWDYDNNGLKMVQLRFYVGVSTNVN